jgi:enoyl-CoA hydratase/carnithine racemase
LHESGSRIEEGEEDELIIIHHLNGLVEVLINRERALNSLTIPMFYRLHALFYAWEQDPTVRAVVMRGAGQRAFCAGGDLKHFVQYGPQFARPEYQLDRRVARFPKPVLALWSGVVRFTNIRINAQCIIILLKVMGGGVGVSIHSRYRVCTETVQFAMPEVRYHAACIMR